LGRLPTEDDVPAIVAEFLSAGKRSLVRDSIEKRDEYMAIGVQEYWLIDSFQRTMTVFTSHGRRIRKQVIGEKDKYSTPLLPGFELDLKKLLALADDWQAQ